jgi:hypothetical protein
VTYGTWNLAGTQYSTPQGGFVSLGPFAIAFGPVTQSQAVLVDTTATVAVPANAAGVCIIPPIGNTTPSIGFSTTSSANATAQYIDPGQPSLVQFDSLHQPANVYLASGGSVTVQVQFT